jgi:hypothetical protein
MDKHTAIGTALAISLSIAASTLATYALAPIARPSVPPDIAEPPAVTVVVVSASPASTHLVAATPRAPQVVTVVRSARAMKKVCDRRGNIHHVGYARPSVARDDGETTALVCWFE